MIMILDIDGYWIVKSVTSDNVSCATQKAYYSKNKNSSNDKHIHACNNNQVINDAAFA